MPAVGDPDLLVVKTVATTLFAVASWVPDEYDVAKVAQYVAQGDVHDWTCYPVCDEV